MSEGYSTVLICRAKLTRELVVKFKRLPLHEQDEALELLRLLESENVIEPVSHLLVPLKKAAKDWN